MTSLMIYKATKPLEIHMVPRTLIGRMTLFLILVLPPILPSSGISGWIIDFLMTWRDMHQM